MAKTKLTRTQKQSIDLIRQSQDAVVDGVRSWSETVGRTGPTWQVFGGRPEEVVDTVFDIAEQTLATQREIARRLWGASADVADTAVQQTSTPGSDQGQDKGKDYESMTVEQLQDEAAKADIEGRSQMNKQELVKALRKHG